MSSKIIQLKELEDVLCLDEKINEGILHFFSAFKIEKLLGTFGAFKSKCYSVSELLLSLLVIRLRSQSINRMQNRGNNYLDKIDDNTFYRLMNNVRMDWRKLLISFAKQFALHVKANGDPSLRPTCYVLDDTDIEKSGKTIEFVGRIFSHVTKLYPLGYKMLLLAFWDGKSLIATDFSLHREKGKKGTFGLSKKEAKLQTSKKRDSNTPGQKRVEELNKKKSEVAILMLRRAVKNGFAASYVLMDSWFVNDYMIKNVRAIKNGAMHLLGMCKLDKRKYMVDKKELNAHQLIAKHQRKKGKFSRKYKSTYIPLIAVRIPEINGQ